MNPQRLDPKEWLDRIDAQWNANDPDAVLATFTPDAEARFVPPLPGAPDPAVGHAQIRQVLEPLLAGFHVTSRDHQLAGENVVTWRAVASSDAFRRLGIESVEADGRASVMDGKMQTLTITFTPATVARLQAALARAAA